MGFDVRQNASMGLNEPIQGRNLIEHQILYSGERHRYWNPPEVEPIRISRVGADLDSMRKRQRNCPVPVAARE
jgi:hypothetical protein